MAGRGVDLTMPAWMTAAGQQQAAAPGSVQTGSMALALTDQPPNQDLYDLSDYDSSDSENQDDFLPPGPLEAEKCTLSGPGFTGGAAGSPVSFVITAKDGRGKRIRDGGAYVRVQVQPMRGVHAEPVDPSIKDHGDGSYTVTYAVSTRGNYELSIELNGSPIGGNPFPVYFSPPDKNAASPAPAAEAAAPPTASAVTSAAIAAAGAVSAGLSGAQQTAGADGQPLQQSLGTLGAQAHAAGVLFPSDDDTLHRTILIANINPLVNTEQVKQLFGFCGQVKSCRMVGNNQFAFVEYSSQGEANAAMGLNGQMLGDRALKVESAKSARESTPQGAANPYTAIQLQQMQQLQLAQMQSSTLAAQVAQLRALAKTNPNAPIATMSANSASQKAAALAAAALLQKKFGQTSGPGNADHAIGKRRSPSADRRNRDRRHDERRHDSQDCRRHDSRDRRRSRSRERRSERTQASADRRREADRLRESREEHRHASRGRPESSHRDGDRDRRSSDRRDRSRDRHERSRRDRSAEQRHGRGSRERARSKDRDHRRRSDKDRKESDRHWSSHRSNSKEADRQKAATVGVAGGAVPSDSGREAVASGKAKNEPIEPAPGTLNDPGSETANGHASQVGEKRSRRHGDDALASPRRKSPSRNGSQSPVRSPSRHKHSKKHKKEHSHKKSKRDKHSAVDRPDDRSQMSDSGTTAAAAPENSPQADVSDDLDALRQAALQTTKPAAVQESVSTGAAQLATAEASKVNSSAQPEPMDTL